VDDAATWLESYLNMTPHPGWADFVAAVMARFGRNQHQILVRRMFHISQTLTVEDYVRRFTQLVDKIVVYESRPDPVHYVTKFLDGLKPTVRVLVEIQQPATLDAAYTLALLYEELGDGMAQSLPVLLQGSRFVALLRSLPLQPLRHFHNRRLNGSVR
jgi:hypothetical protein